MLMQRLLETSEDAALGNWTCAPNMQVIAIKATSGAAATSAQVSSTHGKSMALCISHSSQYYLDATGTIALSSRRQTPRIVVDMF
jgi:hypothetical protein